MPQRDYLGDDRRRYIRLDSVFPVQFRLVALDGKQFLSDWLQGFTNNISKGGICLSINNLTPELIQALKNKRAKLSLKIEMPLASKPVSALADIVWTRDAIDSDKYFVGLIYTEIDAQENEKIIRYGRIKKMFFPVAVSLIAILGLGFVLNTYISIKLINGNRVLVEQLVKILQESSVAKQKVKETSRQREALQLKMQALEMRIKTLEEEKGKLEASNIEQVKKINYLISQTNKEKSVLQEQLIAVQHKENNVTEELLRLDRRKASLEKANIDKMYQWLKVHQNPITGLVVSFEGDNDIANWAFTYDQALVVQAFTNFSDFQRAKKILEFFDKKANKIEGKFVNAYYVNDGSPAEYIVHSGPNIWLGISILQYAKKSQDYSFLDLAEDIALEMINLQSQDPDGGIRGGPNVQWYATEHNLDVYAFFNMLYKVTNKPKYLQARDKVLAWLVKHTYDKADIPIKRGKGDSAIATDTYAWAIAAIGPEKLEELGMSPDRIIGFAEENCAIEVSYSRPSGEAVKIKGFDFAPQRHVARGGIVSSEWTAQMILSFKLMADFYYKKGMIAKARAYEGKADEYMVSLSKMIISSPSPSGQGEGCLPYATQDYVDTGHGWMTPKGINTGSVAGTTYAILAYYKYNPLELKD